MASWNKLTERQFNAIKTLLKGGASQAEASKYMEVSPNTVYFINKAENFAEYTQIQAERMLNRNQVAAMKAKQEAAKKVAAEVGAVPAAQVVEHRQTVTVQATHYMMTEMQKTNELLTAISKKLAFIVQELTGKEG